MVKKISFYFAISCGILSVEGGWCTQASGRFGMEHCVWLARGYDPVSAMRKIVFPTMSRGLLLATGADLFLFSFKRLGNCVQKHNYFTCTCTEMRESHGFADDRMEEAHEPDLKD